MVGYLEKKFEGFKIINKRQISISINSGKSRLRLNKPFIRSSIPLYKIIF